MFLHAVEDGPANRSYGLQVAKLAGVPADTVKQARAYLARLDQFSSRREGQGDLFAAAAAGRPRPRAGHPGDALLDRLALLDPDALSPREALAALYELKKLASSLARRSGRPVVAPRPRRARCCVPLRAGGAGPPQPPA